MKAANPPVIVNQAVIEASEFPPSDARTILWVDDRPKANAFEIAQLESSGVEVIKSKTTAEAMDALSLQQNIKAIISDMGRDENGIYHGKAGIELLAAVRAAGIEAPFMIYTTAKYARRRHEEVVANGGDGAIHSQVELLDWLEHKLR